MKTFIDVIAGLLVVIYAMVLVLLSIVAFVGAFVALMAMFATLVAPFILPWYLWGLTSIGLVLFGLLIVWIFTHTVSAFHSPIFL